MYHSNTITPAVLLVGLLHRPPRDHHSFRRRSSLRGDDIRSLAGSYGSSPKNNSILSNSNSRPGSVGSEQDILIHLHHQQQQQQHQQQQRHEHRDHQHQDRLSQHNHHLPVPSILVDPPRDGDQREIPQAQAEHMAAHWGIPYVEINTKVDKNSVMEAVRTLLDLVLPDLADMTRSRLHSIAPASSRRSSLNWSGSSGERFISFTCCLHC
ncbi:hypothetical protein ElyMa_007017100 [Elysia marginata]|uniref:Uncharacterized protein n=1 Tax=Elysia marginata TaxID=1093978 RepID=A0AAV4JQP9_9GAST|nr:hypothetical protein ElyMa_007017100 [Elysia marginata]